ncbi:MAG: GAF domain-containing protein [Gammaproteobacteria bacterium]|nr:GAF domain-containing protein [Gammaproteobacteria bacterium]NNC56094.1 GAF domain-containing protein [Woeseiaceae bacterium]
MQVANVPENEAARVATLHSLNILDTPREDRFDRYTRITARIFDMPIVLISLVDRYRQWFKSAEGLDADETPRDISFCGHAILGDDIFEIRNARRDARFRDNPLVIEQPHIRFYAGAPLEAPNGHKLGTLCIIDRVPRQLTDEEKTMLKNLADMVVGEMIGYVDTETGLSNRDALISTGTSCFENDSTGRSLSLLLFDISDIMASQNDPEAQMSPAESFAKLLHRHFPDAQSTAHVGAYHFAVLIKADRDFDEAQAVNRFCAEVKKTLSPDGGKGLLSAFVGRVQSDPDIHESFVDMLSQADGMFFRREKQPIVDDTSTSALVKALVSWRKTIF